MGSTPITPAELSRPDMVTRRDYKEFFIEVEIYKQRNGRYYAWPYLGRELKDGMAKEHFVLRQETFATSDEAVNAAIAEGQKKINEGFKL